MAATRQAVLLAALLVAGGAGGSTLVRAQDPAPIAVLLLPYDLRERVMLGDAGSNALFGSLQVITAHQLGLSPVLMAAANSAGGVMGKMIDAQSIIVACAATGQEGREGDLFRAVLVHSIVLAAIVGLIVTAYAYVVPQWIPSGHSFR